MAVPSTLINAEASAAVQAQCFAVANAKWLMLAVDHTGVTITGANQRALDVTGYTLEELTGKALDEVLGTPFADLAEAFTISFGADQLLTRHQVTTSTGEIRLVDAARSVIPTGKGSTETAGLLMAVDVTEAASALLELGGRAAVTDRDQAVVEYSLDGEVLQANRYFADLTGYSVAEMVGQNHEIFVDPREVESPDYATFWGRLRAGEQISGEYKRIGRAGKEFWLRAAYMTVLGVDGLPAKIVEYASTPPPRSWPTPSTRARWTRSAAPRR